MKVVLLEDIPGKGKAGEIKEVPNGYARNFLLPRGLALVATSTVMKHVEFRLEREKLEESVDREKLLELTQQIEGQEIHLKARMGGGERLFGSITAADIAEELSRAIGSIVDKKRIDIERPFRQTGSYEVAVRLASDIKPKITVVVEEETEPKAEKEPEKEEKQAKTKSQERKKETEQKAQKEEEQEEKKERKKGKAKAEETQEVKEKRRD